MPLKDYSNIIGDVYGGIMIISIRKTSDRQN